MRPLRFRRHTMRSIGIYNKTSQHRRRRGQMRVNFLERSTIFRRVFSSGQPQSTAFFMFAKFSISSQALRSGLSKALGNFSNATSPRTFGIPSHHRRTTILRSSTGYETYVRNVLPGYTITQDFYRNHVSHRQDMSEVKMTNHRVLRMNVIRTLIIGMTLLSPSIYVLLRGLQHLHGANLLLIGKLHGRGT